MEFSNKTDILVLFANAYDLKDDSGKQVQGCSVHYLFWGDKGSAFAHQSETDNSKPVGYQRAKVSLPFEARAKLAIAPAIYEGTFSMTVGSDGKPVMKLVDVAYKCNVEFQEKAVPGLYVPGMLEPDAKKTGSK